MPSGTSYVVGNLPHSTNVPYLVGKKAVYVGPSYRRFLRELGNVADITIWNSMRVATVKSVCDFLFKDLPVKPVNILGQESCELIRVCDIQGKVSFLKVEGTDKPMFLKVIRRHLFFGFNGRYAEDNTVIVDDSPAKHVLNPPQNVILPETWTFAGAGQVDTYLMDTLLPWILQLHMNREQGIQAFRNENKIGRLMMCEDLFNLDYGDLIQAINEDEDIRKLIASK
jgi:hypothetical protein